MNALSRVRKGSLEEPRCELMVPTSGPPYGPWTERERCTHAAAGHWLPVPEWLVALCDCCVSGLAEDGVEVSRPLPDMTVSWFPGAYGSCPVAA